jgi:hypothetical protein
MRGDRVGVGDVGEVSDRTRISCNKTSGDDNRRARRKRNAGLVSRRYIIEHVTSFEQGRHWIGIGDGARVEHGTRDVYWTCA